MSSHTAVRPTATAVAASVRARPEAAVAVVESCLERIERLEEDKAAVAGDLREVYAEAKSEGFDVKILKEVIRLRKQDQNERDERDTQLDLYLHAIETAPAPKAQAAE